MGNLLEHRGSRDERAARRYQNNRDRARQRLRRLLPNAVETLSLLPSERRTFAIELADASESVPVTLLGMTWILNQSNRADTGGFILPGFILTTSGQILRFSRGYKGPQNELVQHPLNDPLHDPTFVDLEKASWQGLTLHTRNIVKQVHCARKAIGAERRQAAKDYRGEMLGLVVSRQQPALPYQTLQAELLAVSSESPASVALMTISAPDSQTKLKPPQSVA